MERFENAIFKQREEINNRATEMFGLHKELTVSKTLETMLIREKERYPIIKHVNSISLVRTEEEESTKDEEMFDDISGKPDKSKAVISPKEVNKEKEAGNVTKDNLVKSTKEKLKKIDEEKSGETPNSHYMYLVDLVILDIKEDEKRPFILGTPFLATAKSVIKFDKGTITLRSRKSNMSFHRIPESLCRIVLGLHDFIESLLLSKKVEETLNLRYLEDKRNVQGLGQEWYFDLDYLTDSLGYTRFKTNPPVGPDDTNILAGTQADDSDSECDEQVILVPSFPSNSFLGPIVQDVSAPMENNLDYAEALARLQRQEYEAHYAAAKHGFKFSVDTAALLPLANMEIHRNLVPAAGDPAGGVVPTGGVPAGSDPASSVLLVNIPASSVPTGGDLAGSTVPASDVPAGSFPACSVLAGGVLTGSLVFTDSGASSVPAASVLVPTVVSTDSATTSPLPPFHSLGSCAHTIRFPSPSDLGNHQHMAGIFSSSSYDDDFCADVTNLDSNVVVDPSIHPQSQILGDLQSLVKTRKPSSVANALADPDWVAAMQEEMQQFYHQQVWKLVPLPTRKIAIGTKWILKNKRDARGIVVRNKARLVAQGH
nr:hypothetical protein [Tanacetum cinerariifolium]